MHSSSSREDPGVYLALHPLRRHDAFGGISSDGSSDSDSRGAGSGVGECASAPPGSLDVETATGFAAGGGPSSLSGSNMGSLGGSGGVGVSSTVECFPVVQGGMSRNSSNVRTRRLQHFQPDEITPVSLEYANTDVSQLCFWPGAFDWKTTGTDLFVPHGISAGLDGRHTAHLDR